MENFCHVNLNIDERVSPTDPEFAKGMATLFSCCDKKKCCKKYKKGKRCKKCPGRL